MVRVACQPLLGYHISSVNLYSEIPSRFVDFVLELLEEKGKFLWCLFPSQAVYIVYNCKFCKGLVTMQACKSMFASNFSGVHFFFFRG